VDLRVSGDGPVTTYDLSTFGEGQLRLTVSRGDRLVTARLLNLTAAGSEANVAGLLAQLGRRTSWASVVPTGDLGDRVLSEYRSVGVDLSNVVRGGDGRIALYFLEPGDAPMPGKVTYDRQHTAFREITIDTFDWDRLLDTRLLFVTGITAALTDETAKVTTYAVEAAHDRGIEVALDVNHRTMLWSAEQAHETLWPLLDKVTVLFCSRTDGNRVFGIGGDGNVVCRELQERTGVAHVVSTDRTRGVYYCGRQGQREFAVAAVPVTDRPGAGDAFVGGTLHGYLDGDISAGIGYGLRTASLALTHHGDLTRISGGDLSASTTTDILR
jgi:2-dehydro-3-deoxygluconokinase